MVFNTPSWNINNIFSLNMPPMFLLCFFLLILFTILFYWFYFIYNFFLFCLLKLVLFSKFNSFLPNLLSGENHKAIYPPYSRNRQVLQKKTGNKIALLLFLATKRLCSLLITGRHYSLLVIQSSSRSQISSASLVNVNCSEEIYPVLLKQ